MRTLLLSLTFVWANLAFANRTLTPEQQKEAEDAVKTYMNTLQQYAQTPMGEKGLELRNDIILMFENMLETLVYNDQKQNLQKDATNLSCTLENYLLELGITSDKLDGDIHISYDNIKCKPLLEPGYAEGYDDLNALVSIDKTIKIGNQENKVSNIIRYNISNKKISYIEKASFSTSDSDINQLLGNHLAYSTSKLNEIAARCYGEKKYEQAYQLYEQAAVRGDLLSQLRLVQMLDQRIGCQDYAEFVTNQMAKFWIKKIFFKYLKADGVKIHEDGIYEPAWKMLIKLFGNKYRFKADKEEIPFNSNLMLYNEPDQEYYFFNKSGQQAIHRKFKSASAFSEGLALVSEDKKKFGYINSQGELVIPFIYEHISSFVNGTASVGISKENDGKSVEQYFIINKKGERISDFFDYISWRNNKNELLMPAERNGKYGFINGVGELKIPFIFDNYRTTRGHIRDATDHLTAVVQNGKWGFVDVSAAEGKIVVYPQYKNVGVFVFGRAFVDDGTGFFFIDKNGNKVTDKYSNVSPFNASGYAMVKPFNETDPTIRYIIDKNGGIIFYCNEVQSGKLTNIRRKK